MTPQPATADTGAPLPRGLFGTGIALLAACVIASWAIVQQHLGGLAVPGCGPGSPCAKAAASVWGKVPWVDWPVSFVGLAYFLALLIAWPASRRGVSTGFRQLVRLGALASVGFVVVMLVGGYLCPYCLAAHAANLAFWVIVERARSSAAPSWRPLATVGLAFVLATAALAIVEVAQKQRVQEKEEGELVRSTEQMIQQRSPGDGGGASTQPQQEGPTFTGRYRLGAEAAPIRMVVFSDYQCEDCGHIERDIFAIFDERDDMSLSVKHFPFCTDCNPYVPQNRHENACWAARAAETAGILGGTEGFWRMHHWLFEHEGFFTYQPLHEYVIEQGYDFDEWSRIMQGDETERRVRDDIDEAVDLGIQQTPMIFINGVELKGWRIKGAVQQAVESLATTNPPPLTATHDRPPGAIESSLNEWRSQPVRRMPPDSHAWPHGPDVAALRIVVWGDYQEPFTAQVDQIIRSAIADRSDAQYAFRHYPFNRQCNPVTNSTKHPLACLAAKAAEAAGIVGGGEGYWKMHTWLMSHRTDLSEESLHDALAELGFDAQAFFAALQGADAAEAIAEDAQAGKQMGLTGIPMIYVNGKFVRRWKFAHRQSLSRIIEEASGQ